MNEDDLLNKISLAPCPCGSGRLFSTCCLSARKNEVLELTQDLGPDLYQDLDGMDDVWNDPNDLPTELNDHGEPPENALKAKDLFAMDEAALKEYLEPDEFSLCKSIVDDYRGSHQWNPSLIISQNGQINFLLGTNWQRTDSVLFHHSGAMATADEASLCLFALHGLYQRSKDFFPDPKPSFEGLWSKKIDYDNPETRITRPWNEQQLATHEHLHRSLQLVFGPKRPKLDKVIISLEKWGSPKGQIKINPGKLDDEKNLSARYPIAKACTYGAYHSPWGGDKEGLSMQAVFSDGIRISTLDPIVSAHGFLLPPELIPNESIARSPSSGTERFQWLKRLEMTPARATLVDKIIEWSLAMANQGSFDLFLCSENKLTSGVPLKAIEFKHPQWTLSAKEGGGCLWSAPPSKKKSDGYEPKSGTYCIDATDLDEHILKRQGLHRIDHPKKVQYEFSSLEHFSHWYQQNLVDDQLAFALKTPPLHEEEESLPMYVHLFSNEPHQFGINWTLPDNLRLGPIFDEAEALIRGINGGLADLLNQPSSHLALSRRGHQRKVDMKLLRHQGFARFVIATALQHRIEQGKPSALKRILKKGCTELAWHILDQPVESKPPYSSQISKVINQAGLGIISDIPFYLLRESQVLKISSLSSLAPLFLSIVKKISLNDKKDFLSKNSRQPVISIIAEEPSDNDDEYDEYDDDYDDHREFGQTLPPLKLLNPEDLTQPILSLKSLVYPDLMHVLPAGTQVSIDGQTLETLSNNDFKALLELKDGSSSSTGESWFDLHPKFFFKGEEMSIEEARLFDSSELIAFRGKVYRIDLSTLPDIRWLDRLWMLLKAQDGKQKKLSQHHVELPRSAALEILALHNSGIEVNGGGRWKEIVSAFESMGRRRGRQPKLSPILKDFQRDGVRWMIDLYQLGFGGILADDMGLGKTIQTLAFLDHLQSKSELGNSMIIVPTSLIYNWLSELEKFFPKLQIEIYDPKLHPLADPEHQKQQEGLILCSYGLFQRHGETFGQHHWNVVIFDEAQNLKNISSKRCSFARQLKARSKFCLTGTPMENHFGEFFSLIDLALPGALGRYGDFMKVYGNDGRKGQGPSIEEVDFLKTKSSPLVLRRLKEKMLKELPPKTETLVALPFERQQKSLYREIALSCNENVLKSIDQKGESQSQLEMLTALLRLRQVCSWPGALPKVSYKPTPPKVEVLIEQAEALLDQGESVLVFTNFLSTLHFIREKFEKHRHTAMVLHGSMNSKERTKVLRDFEHSNQPNILMMTLKTGGTGLNLTRANHVFHIEPWWNPATENQATDRAHRMGQSRHVHVVRFIMEHSIEERIQGIKEIKGKAFDALLSEKEGDLAGQSFAKRQLTQKDFSHLLDLNAKGLSEKQD